MNKIFTFLCESQTARFLIPAGIALAVFGVVMFIINIKNQDYIKVDAVVTKAELVEEAHIDANGDHVDATYDVYVKYTVDDKEYETLLGTLPGYKEEDKLSIYYNPENPNEITQTKSLILPIALVVAGLAAIVGGIVSGVNAIKRHNKMKEQEKGWANE